MFIGEGPGRSEDVVGEAFVGRAGQLLRAAIDEAGENPDKVGFTNLVACRPCDGVRSPNRKPDIVEVVNCRPRLLRVLEIVQPQVLVLCGRVPQQLAPRKQLAGSYQIFHVVHPAFIARQGGKSSDAYKDLVKQLEKVFTLTRGEGR